MRTMVTVLPYRPAARAGSRPERGAQQRLGLASPLSKGGPAALVVSGWLLRQRGGAEPYSPPT